MSATLLEAEPVRLAPKPLPKQQAIAQCTLLRPGAAVSGWWARAVGNVVWPFNTVRTPIYIEDDVGGMVAEARNDLVARVLAINEANKSTEITKIFWVDDDVIPVSPMVLRALDAHIDESPIVSGVYFSKETFPQPLIFPEKGQGVSRFEPDTCVRAWGCGMGLTLVAVDLYRRMRDELDLPLDVKGNPEWYRTSGRNVDIVADEEGVLSVAGTEDLYFCDLAARLDVRPVIDCGKHAFGFHYSLGTREVYPGPQWEQYRRNQPVVWKTPDGDVVWS